MRIEQVEDRVYRPMHKLTTDARVKMAKQENLIAKDAIAELRTRLDGAESNIRRAKDVREIENLISAQLYLYGMGQREKCFSELWSARKDIVYGLEDQALSGRETILAYCAEYDKVQAEKLRKQGVVPAPENYGLGELMLDLATSPYIEVAEDGQTAQALIITMSYRGERMGHETVYDHIRSRFGFDFVKEQGNWKIWHLRQLADISLPCRAASADALAPMDDAAFAGGQADARNYNWRKDPPSALPPLPKHYETFSDGQAVTGTPQTKLLTVVVDQVAQEVGVPLGEAQMPPGMTPPPGMRMQPDWSSPGALAQGAAVVRRLARGYDAVAFEGSGASWIFTALAYAAQPATPMIYVPPLEDYVPARPLPMRGQGGGRGIALTVHETAETVMVQVQETGAARDQRELAEMVSGYILPQVAPGKEVYLDGMMPNFAAVAIALGFWQAGAKDVSIRLATERDYTCCIAKDSETLGEKRRV